MDHQFYNHKLIHDFTIKSSKTSVTKFWWLKAGQQVPLRRQAFSQGSGQSC